MSKKVFLGKNSLILILVIASLIVGHSGIELKDLVKHAGKKGGSTKVAVAALSKLASSGLANKSNSAKISKKPVKSSKKKDGATISKTLSKLLSNKHKDSAKDLNTVQEVSNEPIDHATILKGDAKKNKVGFALSMIHKFSEKDAMKKRLNKEEHEELSRKLHDMEPDEMLKELCPRSFGMCERWVARAYSKKSPVIHHIVETIKARPEGVDPSRLFKFKMYEASAGHVVQQGYDEMANSAINMVARKNPYLALPVTAVDFTLSTLYKT